MGDTFLSFFSPLLEYMLSHTLFECAPKLSFFFIKNRFLEERKNITKGSDCRLNGRCRVDGALNSTSDVVETLSRIFLVPIIYLRAGERFLSNM